MHAALACATSRVRCGSLVYSIGYRHPAVLAKAITTIDHLSGGRAEMGLGAGWAQVEYAAFGIPFPTRRRAARPDGGRGPGPARPAARRGHDVRGHVLPGHRGAQRPASRPGASCRSGSVVRARSARCASRRATPTGGTRRSWPPSSSQPSVPSCTATAPTSGAIRSTSAAPSISGWHGPRRSLRGQFGGIADFVRPGVLSGSVDEVVERVGAVRRSRRRPGQPGAARTVRRRRPRAVRRRVVSTEHRP